MVEYLSNIHKAMGSISILKKKKKGRERRRFKVSKVYAASQIDIHIQ